MKDTLKEIYVRERGREGGRREREGGRDNVGARGGGRVRRGERGEGGRGREGGSRAVFSFPTDAREVQ